MNKTLSATASRHEMGNELIRLRGLLQPRVAFATASGWPEQIRTALTASLGSDVRSLQDQLERAFGESDATGKFDRSETEALVAVVRENPLTQVLTALPESPTDEYPPPMVSGAGGRRSFRVRRIIS